LVLGDKSRGKLLGPLEFSYRIAVPRLGGIGSTKTLRGGDEILVHFQRRSELDQWPR
jgi:hypothetical protein